MRPRTWVCYRHWTQSVQTHLLLLRLMTLSLCISPISSGSNSSLLECRKSTDACFQFPIWDERRARSQTLETNSSHCLSTLEQTDRQIDRWAMMCTLTSGGSWARKLWSAANVRMAMHRPTEDGKASISLKLQSSSSRFVRLTGRTITEERWEKKEKHILSEFPQIFCEIQLWLIHSECENFKTGLPWFKLVVADNNVILNITYWSASSKTIWMTLLRLGNIIKFK